MVNLGGIVRMPDDYRKQLAGSAQIHLDVLCASAEEMMLDRRLLCRRR